MRKMIAAATFGLVLSVAGATGPDEMTPEGRAYLGFSFGGEQVTPRNFHYGLRLDHDRRYLDGQSQVPSVMQFDFTPRGFNDARVNGLSIIKPQYRLRQAEEAAAEEVAEEGFFEGMFNSVGNFFGGLFGSDEEEEGEETAEETSDAVPGEEQVAEGTFIGYNAIDWATLAVGAVGLGFVASEVTQGKEDSDPRAGEGEADGGGCSIENPEACEPQGGDPIGGLLAEAGGVVPLFPSRVRLGDIDPATRERLEWLDGGTGQMGDLQPQN